MRMLILCGVRDYEQEVEAPDFPAGVAVAFAIRLPLGIGEIMGVKRWDEHKGKFGKEAFALTEHVLRDAGVRHLYIQVKRRFRLNTEHPEIQAIKTK